MGDWWFLIIDQAKFCNQGNLVLSQNYVFLCYSPKMTVRFRYCVLCVVMNVHSNG